MAQVKLELIQTSASGMRLNHDDYSIRIDRPEEKGGGGDGLMGGQYMLIGIGGCFCSNLFAAAQARNIKIDGLQLTVQASISETSPNTFEDFILLPSYEYCSHEDQFDKLLKIAKKGCISVNTITNGANVQVKSETMKL